MADTPMTVREMKYLLSHFKDEDLDCPLVVSFGNRKEMAPIRRAFPSDNVSIDNRGFCIHSREFEEIGVLGLTNEYSRL